MCDALRQRQPEEHADEFAGEQCPGREARAERAVRLEQRRTARAGPASTRRDHRAQPGLEHRCNRGVRALDRDLLEAPIAHSSSIRPTARMSSARRTGRRRVWSSANLAGSARQLHDREGGASGALESAVSHGSVGVSGGWSRSGRGCMPVLVRGGRMLPDRRSRRASRIVPFSAVVLAPVGVDGSYWRTGRGASGWTLADGRSQAPG